MSLLIDQLAAEIASVPTRREEYRNKGLILDEYYIGYAQGLTFALEHLRQFLEDDFTETYNP